MGPSGRIGYILYIYWTVWDRYMQILYLGRAPCTKETLPDFLKWRRVTRRPLVFRGLTVSQRTPGFRGVIVPSGNHLIALTPIVLGCPSEMECMMPILIHSC